MVGGIRVLVSHSTPHLRLRIVRVAASARVRGVQ